MTADKERNLNQVSKVKAFYENQLDICQEDLNSQIGDLENEIRSMKKIHKMKKGKTSDLINSYEAVNEKLRVQLESNMKKYEEVIIRLQHENRELKEKIQIIEEAEDF